jgi:hypothetical protein
MIFFLIYGPESRRDCLRLAGQRIPEPLTFWLRSLEMQKSWEFDILGVHTCIIISSLIKLLFFKFVGKH